jgi:uncharacterized protein
MTKATQTATLTAADAAADDELDAAIGTEAEDDPEAGDDAEDSESGPERRCIVTGVRQPKDGMIRLVIAPDGVVVPDLEERLPGRGMWLSARRAVVEKAVSGRAFGRAARRAVVVPDGLVDRLEAALAKQCVSLLGLARRSGSVVSGFEKVQAAVRAEKALLLLEATDGSPDERRRLIGGRTGLRVATALRAEELAKPFSRERIVHVAVCAVPGAQGPALAARLERAFLRLAGMRDGPEVPESRL